MSPKRGTTRLWTPCPERLEYQERVRVGKWCRERYRHLVPRLAELWEECHDWALDGEVLSKSWEARFRNWVRTAARYEAERSASRGAEAPQMPRHGPAFEGEAEDAIAGLLASLEPQESPRTH